MKLYRVLLHDPNAAPTEPGGVLYVPRTLQGGGRVDNPGHYGVLYLGDLPAGVCAEVFYRGAQRTKWTATMLPLRRRPELTRSLVTYELPDDAAICDMDDPQRLLEFGLRPSQIITRDYTQSQGWALHLFQTGRFIGTAWWSFNDARWKSYGLWATDRISSIKIEPLAIDHAALAEAASVMDVP